MPKYFVDIIKCTNFYLQVPILDIKFVTLYFWEVHCNFIFYNLLTTALGVIMWQDNTIPSDKLGSYCLSQKPTNAQDY